MHFSYYFFVLNIRGLNTAVGERRNLAASEEQMIRLVEFLRDTQ